LDWTRGASIDQIIDGCCKAANLARGAVHGLSHSPELRSIHHHSRTRGFVRARNPYVRGRLSIPDRSQGARTPDDGA